jgi:hypothetical protein
MARLGLGILAGIVITVVAGAALGLHAQVTEDTAAVAAQAGVDPIDLQGAVFTTGLPPLEYLYATGELERPAPFCGWPICGALGQRIWCVEGIESHHGAAMYNPMPWHGEHAQGYLGWLPSTATRWGVTIGNRGSEWDGARKMLLAGAGGQFFGVATGIC